MGHLLPTAEMTLGPFFPGRYVDDGANDLAHCQGRVARGEIIEIQGTVTQEDGAPLHNLVLEIWQADANGIFNDPLDPRWRDADPAFFGWGRAATDSSGRYLFRTIRPGRYAMDNGTVRAPHINVAMLFSGIGRHLQTALFFEDSQGNDRDPVLLSVPSTLRERMLARRSGPGRYQFDIRLRGEDEGVFFED